MKSIPFLISILALTFSLSVFAQEMDAESEDLAQTEELMASDEIAALTENVDVGEMERQEDMIHPEGENDWSLGGEDLPAEDFE